MPFKIIRKNCCGLDVHKTWIYACIGITDAKGLTSYKEKRFSSFTKGLRDLSEWLSSYSCSEVCMESTGKYWIPVFNVLEKSCKIVLSHPKYTKPLKGNKTDRKDAKWICNLFIHDMIKPSFIPPEDIRHLRDLTRYRFKLTCMITGEKNRAQNCLTVSNLKLDDVFTDVFGKSSMSITNYILENPGVSFDVTPFVHPRCKSPISEIQAAIDGSISKEQAVKLRECLNHIDELKAHQDEIEKEIISLASSHHQKQLDLIRTVPGLNNDPLSAIRILAEIGSDMSVFPSAKHLASWAGVCPRNDRSQKRIKSTRISKAGSYLKPLLVQVVNALVKSHDHPEITQRFFRIKSHRGHQKAVIAICRMLLTAIWHMLSGNKPYSPDGYLNPRSSMKGTVLTTAQALNLLKSRGYIIRDSIPPLSA